LSFCCHGPAYRWTRDLEIKRYGGRGRHKYKQIEQDREEEWKEGISRQEGRKEEIGPR
jgi:hypothetical protein